MPKAKTPAKKKAAAKSKTPPAPRKVAKKSGAISGIAKRAPRKDDQPLDADARAALDKAGAELVGKTYQARTLGEPDPSALQFLSVTLLEPDAENFRTFETDEGGDELMASIRANGVRATLEVFPLKAEHGQTPGAPQRFGVVTGNRRCAKTKQLLKQLEEEIQAAAGADDKEALVALMEARIKVPCRILTPAEVEIARELQLIENLVREDVDPIDEANGFQWLIQHRQDTPESIALKVGKSVNRVRQRLKMLAAPEKLLKAVRKGKVSASVAEMIGRIPGGREREQAAGRVLDPMYSDEPMTRADVREMIARDYMRALSAATFDTKAPDLIEGAGPCASCPHLAANNPDIEREDTKGDARRGGRTRGDVCLNTACFEAKEHAAFMRFKAEGEKDGVTVLDEAEAAEAFSGHNHTLSYHSEWVDERDKPGERDTGHFDQDKVPTWKTLAKGAKGFEFPVTIARHPVTGKTHRLLRREQVVEAVNAHHAKQRTPSPFQKTRGADQARAQQQQQQRDEQRRMEREAARAVEHLLTKLAGVDPDPLVAVTAITAALFRDHDAAVVLSQVLGVNEREGEELAETVAEQILEQVQAQDGSPRAQLAIVHAYWIAIAVAGDMRWHGTASEDWETLAEVLKITPPEEPTEG